MGRLEQATCRWIEEFRYRGAPLPRQAPSPARCGRLLSGRISPDQILGWLLLLLFFALASAGGTTLAQATSPAEQALLVRAQAFAGRGQFDRAAQAWKQVLLSDPRNQEALEGVARAEMALGDRGEAEVYLGRLRQAGGDAKMIQQIEAMPQGQPSEQRLELARSLSEKGQYADAMAIYRGLYGDDPPAGDVALAYYDTEAALPAERSQGVDGLRSLVQRFPADPRYAITLGRALTYTPATRAEGIAILQRYPDIAAAEGALKQAERWEKTAAGSAARPPSAESVAIAADYRALNHGSLAEARDGFQRLLTKDPSDRRALSGMGYVLMKQGNFAAAERCFERAREEGASGLDGAIIKAQYLKRMAKGADELKDGATAAGMEDLRAAVALEPANPDALQALAGALWQAKDERQAATAFASVVHLAPERLEAWRGLFLTQSAAGDPRGALTTSEGMTPLQRMRLENDPEYLRVLAADKLEVGSKDGYQKVVDLALGAGSPQRVQGLPAGVQRQWANLLMNLHQYGAAIAVLQQVLAAAPEDAQAWSALISAQHQLPENDAALATAARMPQPVLAALSRDPEFLALMGSIEQSRQQWALALGWLQRAMAASTAPSLALELQLADVDIALGQTEAATAIAERAVKEHPEDPAPWHNLLAALHQEGHDQEALHELAAMPEPVRRRLDAETGFLRLKASIQGLAGQLAEAAGSLDRLAGVYADEGQAEPVDALLQSAWVYMDAGDDRRLASVMVEAAQRPQLGGEERLDLQRVLSVWSLRTASSLAKEGDLHASIALLEATERVAPGEPGVRESLAGLYLQAGEAERALAMYQSLDVSTASPEQFQVAIGAAMAAGNKKQASTWLHSALDRFPRQVKILKIAGDYEQSVGRSAEAGRYYREALLAVESAAPGAVPEEIAIHPKGGFRSEEATGTQAGDATQGNLQVAGGSMGDVQTLLRLLEADAAVNVKDGESLAATHPASQRGGADGSLRATESPSEEIQRQLDGIKGQFSPWVGATADGGYRSGQPGYDQLFTYSAEGEASATLGERARLTLMAGPVRLDAGTARVASTLRLGTLPANAIPVPQMASGLAGELQLHADDFAGFFGTTPRGFLVTNWTGGVLLQPPSAHFTLTLSRNSIQDSELAYSGLRDEGSAGGVSQGNIWGGVIANSGEVEVASGGARSGWYLQGGYQYITGRHVPVNRRGDGDVGAYWTAWRRAKSGSLTIGMNFFGMHYGRNLYDFTYGQGGYFSPQAFAIAAVPVNLAGRSRRHWHYKVSGNIGVQAFYEASTPYFPLDPAIQSEQGNLYFPASTTVSANYSFDGELSYAVHQHWYLGSYADFNNARDYAESKAGIFLRYVFAAENATAETAPTGLFPTKGYRPILVP